LTTEEEAEREAGAKAVALATSEARMARYFMLE
jgi:hypothetical protein